MYPIKSHGYDPICNHTPEDVEDMYAAEGVPPTEARDRAEFISKEINKLNRNEYNLWAKVRAHEIAFDPQTLDRWVPGTPSAG